MSIRSKEIYVSGKTYKRLYWMKELEEEEPGSVIPRNASESNNGLRIVTLDEIADVLINQRIEEVYPNIKTLEKKVDALNAQLLSELRTPTSVEK